MPNNLVRYHQTGDLHFVTFSCHQRLPYLITPEARDHFEHSLEAMRLRYDFFITAYVIMPEHVHLLLSEPRKATLATALQALKLSVAVKRNERPFWLKRYFDLNVWSERKIIEKRRYIHRNPVTRGLVEDPDKWKWSSFRHWWTGETAPWRLSPTGQRDEEVDRPAARAGRKRPANPGLRSETWSTRFPYPHPLLGAGET